MKSRSRLGAPGLGACTLLALVTAAGCPKPRGTDPPADDEELSLACPQHICGQNDPRLNDYRFDRLNLEGQRDAETGSRYLSFADPAGRQLRLGVTPQGELYGVYPDRKVLRGPGLIGSRIKVEIIGKEGQPVRREITIKGATRARSMSTDHRPLVRYWLAYGIEGGPARMPLCYGTDSADFGVLVSRDELYDRKGREVSVPFGDPRARNWINFLCRDHALEKMKRMSYDPARGPRDPYRSTVSERNATIKMITAAYCENAEGETAAFTRPGTDVFWQDRRGWVVEGTPPTDGSVTYELEAYWNEQGAMCLQTRRALETRGDEISRCWSRLPTCDVEPTGWLWKTYVPVVAP